MLKLKNPPFLKLFGTVIHKSKLDDYYDAAPLRLCLPNQSPVLFNRDIVPAMAANVPSPAPAMAANPENQSKKKRKSTTLDSAGTNARKKEISRKKRNTWQENLKVPEVIPSEFMEIIRTEQDFLCRKELSATDVKPRASRIFVISLSKAGIFNRFLNLSDMEKLNTEDGLPVNVVDSGKRFHEMDLAVWPSVRQVVLKKSWTPFVRANELKAGDILEFWGYREDGRFCLAVRTVRNQSEEEAHKDESQNSNTIDLSLSLNIHQQISIDSSSDESVCTRLCL